MTKDTYFILDIKVKKTGELDIIHGSNEIAAMARAKLKHGEFEVMRRQTQSEYLKEMGL